MRPDREPLSLTDPMSYAGDVPVLDAWQQLTEQPDAVLIDVRSHAEWTFVGVPVLDAAGKDVVTFEWASYPVMQPQPDFAERLEQMLRDRGVANSAPLYFLCRSGVRSRHAAIDMTRQWQGPCYNIEAGFEGDMDGASHRASCNGWKFAGLPWRQF